MKCRCCDVILNDSEAKLKYENSEEVSNPEDRYIGLCNRCLRETDISHYRIELHGDELDDVELEENEYD